MATKITTTPASVGIFLDRSKAQKAVSELRAAGFNENEIGLVTSNSDGNGGVAAHEGDGNNAAEGAAIGAATGIGVGALWAIGIAAGFLPAIGPAIAGGIFASILASAASGAAVGGLVGALVGMGIPEEEAEYYESEVKAGRTIVTVATDARAAEAVKILRANGGSVRDATGAPGGARFQGKNRFASSRTTAHGRTSGALEDTDTGTSKPTIKRKANASTIELKKEELRAEKTNGQVGEVRVRKEVVTERKTLEVPVTREEVVIEHRPVQGKAASSVAPGGEIRIPVKEERVHVEKDTVVKEEVSIGKRRVTSTAQIGTDVKHEELRVEKEGQVPLKDSRKPSPAK